jgi:hypothetical protein
MAKFLLSEERNPTFPLPYSSPGRIIKVTVANAEEIVRSEVSKNPIFNKFNETVPLEAQDCAIKKLTTAANDLNDEIIENYSGCDIEKVPFYHRRFCWTEDRPNDLTVAMAVENYFPQYFEEKAKRDNQQSTPDETPAAKKKIRMLGGKILLLALLE